jgi:hypothetical protein
MKLSDILSQSQSLTAPTMPSLQRISVASERILNRWPDVVVVPPEKDRERVVAEMFRRVKENSWKGTRLSFVNSAARALFDEERSARPDLADLRDFYYREIVASVSRSFLGAMFSIYISTFNPDAIHTKMLAKALEASRVKLGSKWKQLLVSIPEILSVQLAAKSIAIRMVSMEQPWNDLKKMGLRSPHAPGLMDFAHYQYIDRLAPRLHERSRMERLLTWLKPEGQEARSSGSGDAVIALLRASAKNQQSENDRLYLYENLVLIYGDPRVKRSSPWSDVPEAEMAGLFAWLTGENIKFFLDVVSKVDPSHMWEPRRKFWLNLYTQGRISAAWVAFSNRGAIEARNIRSDSGASSSLNFGIQTAGGIKKEISLLILKIGNKIVVEGSNNYKVHIFDDRSANAPKLYARTYDSDLIRHKAVDGLTRIHVGHWEDWVLRNL